MIKVAVIGIGQSLRGDDAAGLEAVRQWQERFPETASRPELRVEACELPGLALLDMLAEVDHAILVDAVHSSARPGTLHHLYDRDLSAFTSDSKSAHGWGVAETLQLGYQLQSLKAKLQLIGIEADQMEVGTGLSNTVKEAIPIVCRTIEKELQTLLVWV